MWLDGTVSPSLLRSMKPYQRVNHFPGMYAIARKSNLCMNLNKLRKVLPNHYNFYPETWFLPAEFREFEKHLHANGGNYIVKPAASSQGKGIFIVNDLQNLNALDDYIVQKYIESPLLIDGLKFDMRIYVLVTGCSPLRIFIHKEGLARFATEKYKKPSPSNFDKICMHLTNYSVNKQNPKFIKNITAEDDNVGHKRSLHSTLMLLENKGYNIKKLWKQIADIVIKTLCSIQPSLEHTYKTCKPDDLSNSMCFEILGFDVLVDNNLKPWLLEVNHSPSFEIASPLDKKVKSIVIRDALRILNLNEFDKENYEIINKAKIKERSVYRRGFYDKIEEIQAEKEEIVAERNEFEEENSGGFEKIYPKHQHYYDGFINEAKNIWEIFTGAKKIDAKTRPKTCERSVITPQPRFIKQRSVEKYSPYIKVAEVNKLKAYKDKSLLRV